MGFLDRFKKDASSPDAYTREVAIRVRNVPGVESVEAVDADLLSVRWAGRSEPVELSIAEHRDRWQSASGFDRIEVVDDLIAAVHAPSGDEPMGIDSPQISEPVAAVAAVVGRPTWADAGPRILPALRAPSEDTGAVAWAVAGAVEAVACLEGEPVTAGDVEAWPVGADEVRRTAIANLVTGDPALDPVAPDTRAWVPTSPAGAQAAWLTAPDALLAAAGLDGAIVFVPTPTDLVVVDPADVDLLVSITTSTLAIVDQQATTVSAVPFEIRPGQVAPWNPPADHPCAPLVDRARSAD